MKKIYGILVAAGVLLAMIPVSTMADPVTELSQDKMVQDTTGLRQRNNQKIQTVGYPSGDTSQKKVSLRGIWGYDGDSESDGYFGGRLIRKNRFVVFKGLCNTTGNESMSQVVGIMRHGFFNGKIVASNGSKCPITGLYRINKEKHLLKLRWMTPHESGWAVAKIIVHDQ